MKKTLLKPNLYFLFSVFLGFGSFSLAQRQAIKDPASLENLGPGDYTESRNPSSNTSQTQPRQMRAYGKTQIVNPVGMGRASNAFSTLRPEQNHGYSDDSTGMVTFIHRGGVTVWGGAATHSCFLRYDISFDGGQTFLVD